MIKRTICRWRKYRIFFALKSANEDILGRYGHILTEDASQTNGGGTVTTLQGEIEVERKEIQKTYGWFFLAKEVSDFTNTTYFEIMDTAAVEVFSIVQIMQAKARFHKAEHQPNNHHS